MDGLPPRPVPTVPLVERLREWVEWFGPARLLGAVASALAVCAGAVWLLRPAAPPVEAGLPFAGATSVASTVPVDATELVPAPVSAPADAPLVVHVAGAVALPGVYTVGAGSRVIDALGAAGGPAADARVDALNLAATLRDGDRVYVPRVDEVDAVPAGITPAAAAGDGGAVPAGPVNLNTATVDELDLLPGVGPATAAAVVAYRTANGPFASVEMLAEVRGIGPAKLEAIRALVTI